MKIYIAVDMEGATGVVHPDQLMPDGRGYAAAQRYLTADVKAVVGGILAADPEADIVIGDGHGLMRNVLLDDLPPQARLVVGPGRADNKPLCQVEGIDASFDLAMLVGFHSMAGTPGGLLAHTFIGSAVAAWSLNGHRAGEAEIDAAVLGHFGVPVGLIVGNSDLEAEVAAWYPSCPMVVTKQTLGPTAAICLPPSRTGPMLTSAAEQVVRQGAWRDRAYTVGETTMEIDLHRREMAQRAVVVPYVELVGDRTIRTTASSADEAFRRMWLALTMALAEPPAWLT